MHRSLALIVGMVVLAWASGARATVVGCQSVTAGKVVLNHCNNHNYFARSEPFRTRLEVEALDRLRIALVRAGRLPDATVLVEHQPWRQNDPQITRRRQCTPDAGDSDGPTPSLGACIHITAEDLPRTWSTLRTVLLAATGLSARRPVVPLDDLTAIGRRLRAERYRGIVVVGRSYPAPGGKWSVRERWQDGELGFQLLRGRRIVRRLAKLDGIVTVVPQWSNDGASVAFATLGQVKHVRLRDGRTFAFDIGPRLPKDAVHFDTRLRWASGQWHVAADTNLLASYRAWRWSPETGKVTTTQKDGEASLLTHPRASLSHVSVHAGASLIKRLHRGRMSASSTIQPQR